MTATVAEVRRETPGAVTLRLDLGGAPFAYRPGQYIEIDPHQFPELAENLAKLEAAKGMPEAPRAFSLASDGLEDGMVEISVKAEPGRAYAPVLTPWLVGDAKPGLKVVFTGPNGRYCLPEVAPAGSGFLHICAGSGVAPNRGMIRSALGRGWPQRHLLVLQNRSESDVFYRGEWPDLLAHHPDRLRVRHLFSSAGEYATVEGVRAEMAGWIDGQDGMALVCGPNRPRDVGGRKEPGFCEKWAGHSRRKQVGWLAQLGFTPDRILTEMW